MKEIFYGTCCTCQECGYSYDDCVCDNNRKLEKLNILLGREIGDDQSARIEFTGLELKTLALLILSEAQKFKDKTEAENLIIKIYGKIIDKIKNREKLK